ncbi:hypothetical protein QWT76_29375 [Klebsiella pneumoniae]|nr:hypothetical protein [Klebsiella pneumoniae]MDN3334841.1 hypothetical protein [Klebsiella pneumoniae]
MKMPAFEWVHVQLHQQKGMISLSPPTICNSAPDGYVMVPKEPTREILDEFDSIIDYGAEGSVDAWRRLLASAPQEVKGE